MPIEKIPSKVKSTNEKKQDRYNTGVKKN